VRELSPIATTAKKKARAVQPAATPAARHFTFSEGSSDKFWEISQSGVKVTVRYGRAGTNGQTNVKSFPIEEAASKHVAKLCAEKLAKGYKESVEE
jgi:predicted DNA-binding WGR domain protein